MPLQRNAMNSLKRQNGKHSKKKEKKSSLVTPHLRKISVFYVIKKTLQYLTIGIPSAL